MQRQDVNLFPCHLPTRTRAIKIANKMSQQRDQDITTFETWHISTISGLASQDLKNSLSHIWNCEKSVRLRRWKLSLIEERFEITSPSIHILNKDLNVLYLGRDSSSLDELVLKASKRRKLSLQDIVAAKICERLSTPKHVQSLLMTGEITHSVTGILLKYL